MKKPHASLDQLIRNLKEEKAEIERRIVALETAPKSVEERLLREYIRTRSTARTADYAKEQGIRSSNGRAFAPRDVSDIIIGEGPGINPALLRIAREIFDRNRQAASRYW
jgi:hypothetical protein